MKTTLLQFSKAGLLLAGLLLVAGCHAETASSAASANPDAADLLTLRPAPDVPQLPPTNVTPEIAANPVAPVALPADFNPSPNLKEVIKLAQAGVDSGVVLSYVTNAPGSFGVTSDAIIYLNDLGVANEVIVAMMQRDHAANNYSAPVAAPTSTIVAQPADPTAVVQTPAPTVIVEPPPVTVKYLQENLSPYGSWIEVEGYGRCWQPVVVVQQPNWQPYCDRGRWIYSDCGWYWASDYSWGKVAFHYGRWFRHARWGWCWMPDTVWGPSWVSWRQSSDYCGWAPLPPAARFRPGFGFSYYNRDVSVSFDFGISADCYTFVPARRFYDARPGRYALPRREVTQVFHNTTVINNIVTGRNNTVVNRGFTPAAITAATHHEIRTVPVHDQRSVIPQSGFGRREGSPPNQDRGWNRSPQNSAAQPGGHRPAPIVTPSTTTLTTPPFSMSRPVQTIPSVVIPPNDPSLSANREDQGARWNNSRSQLPAKNPTFDRIRSRNPQPSAEASVVAPTIPTPAPVFTPSAPQIPANRDDQRARWNNSQPQSPASNPAFDRNDRRNFQPTPPPQRQPGFSDSVARQPIARPQQPPPPIVQPTPVRPQPTAPQFVPTPPTATYAAPVRPQYQAPIMSAPQRMPAMPPAAVAPSVSSPSLNPRDQFNQRREENHQTSRDPRDKLYQK